jgi:hypothetical protein
MLVSRHLIVVEIVAAIIADLGAIMAQYVKGGLRQRQKIAMAKRHNQSATR